MLRSLTSATKPQGNPMIRSEDMMTFTASPPKNLEAGLPAARLWPGIHANQFASLLANNKLKTCCSEKYGCQTPLICHNRRAEEANPIILLSVYDSSSVDTVGSQGRVI